MRELNARALALLFRHGRSLLALHLTFTGLSITLLAPLFTAALAAIRPLMGDAAVTTAGLLEFMTSPGGLLWLLLTLFATVLLMVFQLAAITLIAAQNPGHPLTTTARALLGTGRASARLGKLAGLLTGAHTLVSLPFLAAITAASALLLKYHDPYLLNLERPPALWWYGGFCLVMVAGMLGANGWLLLRWIMAVPLIMLKSYAPLQAVGSSSRLTRGRRSQAGLNLLLGASLVVAAPALATLAFEFLATAVFRIVPEQSPLLLPSVVLLVCGYLLTGLALTFLATSAFGTLMVGYYQKLTGIIQLYKPGSSDSEEKQKIRWAWLLEATVIALVVFQSFQIVSSLAQEDTATVTAHRGSPFTAPENTLAALEQAIDDGADYIEIDVQLTADGVPVLWHDNDMMRIFGLPERIPDVRMEDIAELDAGSWFDDSFANQRIATLSKAIDTVKGRVRLFIDLKPNRNEQALVKAVIKLLQEKNATNGTIIAASDWPSLELAKSLEPDIRTALLAQFVVGPLWQDRYDILGLRFNRANPAAIARAHRAGNEFHVWTVNQREEMARFLDMGVDNIITDRPEVLASLLEERKQRSNAEQLAMKVRNWLR